MICLLAACPLISHSRRGSSIPSKQPRWIATGEKKGLDRCNHHGGAFPIAFIQPLASTPEQCPKSLDKSGKHNDDQRGQACIGAEAVVRSMASVGVLAFNTLHNRLSVSAQCLGTGRVSMRETNAWRVPVKDRRHTALPPPPPSGSTLLPPVDMVREQDCPRRLRSGISRYS